MAPEQREALDRFLVYERMADAGEGLHEYDQINDDLVDLARAYLDEHPADDDVPVDEKWLHSVVTRPTRGGFEFGNQIRIVGNDEIGYSLYLHDVMEMRNPTRGDVRLLCKALKIPMNDPEWKCPLCGSGEKGKLHGVGIC